LDWRCETRWEEAVDTLTDGSSALTAPRISLANIVGLVVGATVASIVAFLLVLLFGVSLHPSLLVSAGASNAWFIAAYGRRSRRLGWDTLRTRFAAWKPHWGLMRREDLI
jgi:hypothetical protein